MCEEGKGGSAPKCSLLSCSAGIGLGLVFYSYIPPGAVGESGQDTEVIF